MGDLATLAAREAEAYGGDALAVEAALRFCDSLGQFIEFPGGYVAYLRVTWDAVDLLQECQWHAVVKLPTHLLKTGPVLYVVGVAAEAQSDVRRVLRDLQRLPGVEALAAWRLTHGQERWALRLTRQGVDHGRRIRLRNEQQQQQE